MKLATWNVNSIRARLDRTLAWLEANEPDVLCLQELKTRDEDFPAEELAALGYQAAAYGQPTYNGVAILAREPLQDIRRGFDDGAEEDPQARLVAATVAGVRVISAYVPNGGDMESDKYPYKLRWLARLRAYLERHHDPSEPLVLCGDVNIARDERDLASLERWKGGVLYNPEVRAALDTVLDWGLVDTYRLHNDEGGRYSWWDYRRLSFPRDEGMRIDYVFATKPLAERCREVWMDRDERKGEKPSDHVPVVALFDGGAPIA